MKRLVFICVLLPFTLIRAQEDKKSPFDNYGPYGATVYTDLKTALGIEKNVLKLNLSYTPADPKLWMKIGKLKDLQALNLQTISVSQWPADFSQLYNLVYLASFNNEFKTFPDKMGSLSNLMYLEFFNSKIDSIPSEIAYLQRLKTFKFSTSNDTLKLPKSLKYMKSVTEFIIESAILDSMPKPAFSLPAVKTLVLANCGVQAMPENLDKLASVEVLVLSFNKLTAIPREIYKCKNLYYLSLKKNNITKIPDTICHLTNLTRLDLRENPICVNKDAIEELKILLPGCQILYQ
jgi:leucine-rich repeat protein SHOC2